MEDCRCKSLTRRKQEERKRRSLASPPDDRIELQLRRAVEAVNHAVGIGITSCNHAFYVQSADASFRGTREHDVVERLMRFGRVSAERARGTGTPEPHDLPGFIDAVGR